MSAQYSHETNEILADFLDKLSQEEHLDPAFVARVAVLVKSGKLADRTSVQVSINDLKERFRESSD